MGLTDTVPSVQAGFDYTFATNCLPITTQFNDTSTAIGTTITARLWDFGDGTTDTSQGPFHDFLVNGSYTVTLTVNDDSGHTSTISQLVSINITMPSVNLPPDTSVCQGTPIILDAGPQPPGVQYYWSTGETTRTIQVDTTGDYYVQAYFGYCQGYSEIHVSAKPEMSVKFGGSQADSCLPITMHFTDLTEICGTNIIYRRWDFDNGDSSHLQNPNFLYASAGAHTVSLTERDDNGVEMVSTQTIYVNNNAGLVNLPGDTVICFGTPLVLDAGNQGNHYLWSTGDTTRTLSVMDGGTYLVKVTNNNCIGWDSLVVSAIFPLAPGFSADITSKCLPVLVHFTDGTQILCGSSPVTGWNWNFGDSSSSQQPSPDHIYNKAGRFTVKLTVHNSLGVSATASNDIVITTIGPVSVPMDAATICLGNTVTLDAANEGSRYAWTPAALLTNDTIHNPVAMPHETTLFKVQVTKCGVTVTGSVMVYVDSVSHPVIQYDGATLLSQPAVTYQWYKDSAAIPGATSRTYKPLTAGYYQVEISNLKGCFGRSANYFFLSEGVVIPGSKMKVKVSPSPATGGSVNLLFSKMPGEPAGVNVYDAYGRKMYSGSCSNVVNPIDCSHFYKGQYFVEVLIKGQRVVLPLLIL